MPKIYAVASAKGGVGKTTTAANLAATLAAAGYATVAVDADLGAANLAPALGVEPGEATLHDVLAGDAAPPEAIREGPHGLAVLPGGQSLDDFRRGEPGELVGVLEAITGAEYVIVDTGGGLTHAATLPLRVADGVLLVSTPTRDGLSDTRRTQELTDRLGGEVSGLALTRATGDEDTGAVDVPVLGSIPDDPLVAEATAAGVPLSVHAPDSDAAASFRSLASSLTGEPIRPPLSEGTDESGEGFAEEDEAKGATDEAEGATDVEGTEDEDGVEAAEERGSAGSADGDGDSDHDDDFDRDAAEDDPLAALGEAAAADGPGDAATDDGAGAEANAAAEPAGSDTERSDEGDADPSDGDDAVGTDGDDAVGVDGDDAVILDDDGEASEASRGSSDSSDGGEEDRAAAAARSTVLEAEDYEEFRDGAVTVEDAETGESAEIGEDVIPFASENRERTEEARQGGDGDEDDGDGRGGFLGRLFR